MLALKRININVQLVSKIIVLMLLFWLIYWSLLPSSVHVTFDNLIDVNTKTRIEQLLLKNSLNNGSKPLNLLLQKDFPAVKSVSIIYQASQAARVSVKSNVPRLCLISLNKSDETFVLTENCCISSKNYFDSACLNQIDNLYVDCEEFINEINKTNFKEFACNIKQEIFQKYRIIWKSKNEIILEAKSDAVAPNLNFLIVTDINSFYKSELIKHAEFLYSRKQQNKKKLKIDIRFRDSLICAPVRQYCASGGGDL